MRRHIIREQERAAMEENSSSEERRVSFANGKTKSMPLEWGQDAVTWLHANRPQMYSAMMLVATGDDPGAEMPPEWIERGLAWLFEHKGPVFGAMMLGVYQLPAEPVKRGRKSQQATS